MSNTTRQDNLEQDLERARESVIHWANKADDSPSGEAKDYCLACAEVARREVAEFSERLAGEA